MMFIIDICDIDLIIDEIIILDINNNDKDISKDQEILHWFFDLRDFVKWMNFRIDFEIIMKDMNIIIIANNINKINIINKIDIIDKL